jgi:hypothetical protein
MIETLRPLGVLHVYSSIMLKWLLTVLIGLVILAVLAPRSRLPGDFRVPLRGRMLYIPLGSTIALTLLVWGLSRLI